MIRRHVRPETLARYNEGDLTEGRAARISSHLARCARCAGIRDDLARVPALLARIEVPPPPDHLAARIHTALATESARRASAAGAASPDGAADPAAGLSGPDLSSTDLGSTGRAGRAGSPAPSAAPGRSSRPGRNRSARPAAGRPAWRTPRTAGWAAAAAALVVAAGGGGYAIIQGLGSGESGSGTSSAGRAAAVPPGAASRAAGPVIRAQGPAVQYQHDGQTSQITPVSTGTNFVPGQLAAQASAALAEYSRASTPSPKAVRPLASPGSVQHSGSAGSGGSPGSLAQAGGFSLTGLAACVSRVAAGNLVLLVDVAAYQSAPAAVIVTAASGQSPRQVWVVGPACSASTSDVLNHTVLAAGG